MPLKGHSNECLDGEDYTDVCFFTPQVSFPIRGGAGRALAEVAKTGAAPVQFPLHASGRGLIRDPLAKASGGARGL